MTMRTASTVRSPCELVRKINDLVQGDNEKDLEIRILCSELVKQTKRLAKELNDNGIRTWEKWWDKNPEFKKELPLRLHKDYKVEYMKRIVTLNHLDQREVDSYDYEPGTPVSLNGKTIEEVKEEIAKITGEPVENIKLFGSRIRNTNRPGSDLDVIILSKQNRIIKRDVFDLKADIRYMITIPNNFKPYV